MELNQNVEQLRQQGFRLAAVSYDAPTVLKHFATRQKIVFPLLSDAGSKTIRTLGILNESVPKDNPFFGVPHPVTFVVDRAGKVLSKYFEDDYRQRPTLAAMLARDYNVAPAAAATDVQAKRAMLHTAASTAVVRSGQKILLAVEVALPKGLHMYAPGAQGYIPAEWKLAESPQYQAFDVKYPQSRVMEFPVLNERAPVFEGRVRFLRDVMFGTDKVVQPGPLTVEGTFRYQACDEKQCFPPETVPLKWTLTVEPHDRERVPKELRGAGLR